MEEKNKNKNTTLLIIFTALVLVLAGVSVAFFMNNPKQTKTKSVSIGPLYPLNPFLVNLLNENESKYLKVSLDMELSDRKLLLQIDKKKPLIRDIIIRVLSSKAPEQIDTVEGKERLKNQLKYKINKILENGKITNIFFTDFIIQ